MTEDLTLLKRRYVDVDSDGKNESIELYTSAKRAPDSLMGWVVLMPPLLRLPHSQ